MDVQNMVPEAIKKQGDEADALHRKLYPEQYPAGGEQTQGKESRPEQDQGAAKPEEKKPAEAAKPVEPAKESRSEREKEAPAEDWKQKYDTLQGKYNAEVPALHMAVASLTNQLKELQGKISAPAPSPEKPEEKKEEGKKEEIPEDKIVTAFKEEYPDIFEAVAKMIGPKPKGEEKPKEEKPKEAKSKEEKLPPSPTGNPRTTFDFYLNRDVPDWKQVNTEPEFLMFLGSQDPNFPGMTKLQSIQAAYDAADATTVIGHFRDFKAGKKTTAPGPGPAAGPEKELRPEEKFLAPPKGGRIPAGSETGPSVTAQDLTKFYDEARRGLWGPINEEKFRKEEARLLAALTKKT